MSEPWMIQLVERDHRVHSSAFRQLMTKFHASDEPDRQRKHLNDALLMMGAVQADERRLAQMSEEIT